MKLAAYLRVSTEGQADAYGLSVQLQACRAWARAGGHRIVTTCADEGVSGVGAELHRRTALLEALNTLRDGRVEGIVVHRLDRWARELVLQEQLLAEVHRLGGVLRSTAPAEDALLEHDPADPSRKLVRQVVGAVAEYEAAIGRLRMAAGREHKRAAGGYAVGRPPYGWRAERGELVPVEAEQHAIRRMRAMARRGLSLRAIAAELEACGIPTRAGSTWHPSTVALVLRRSRPPAGLRRPLSAVRRHPGPSPRGGPERG